MEPRILPDVDHEGYVLWVHECTEGNRPVYGSLPINVPHGWQYDADADTLTSSVLCKSCGTHGFWTNGRWKPV
jgi:hypothetical protein